ncbi:hypothetical protein AYI70_g8598 [Smittium culicis]|uniref:Uncharacterized protein n=1 Tax=Smittium culicis TaxID=133412 RepID=A0A1R1XF92_9FUNG|nr:hypothetical protein AYI70_g8598 [Smittium culicis]
MIKIANKLIVEFRRDMGELENLRDSLYDYKRNQSKENSMKALKAMKPVYNNVSLARKEFNDKDYDEVINRIVSEGIDYPKIQLIDAHRMIYSFNLMRISLRKIVIYHLTHNSYKLNDEDFNKLYNNLKYFIDYLQ